MSNMNQSHMLDTGDGIVVYISVEVSDDVAIALYRNEVRWSEKMAETGRDLANYLIDGKDGLL